MLASRLLRLRKHAIRQTGRALGTSWRAPARSSSAASKRPTATCSAGSCAIAPATILASAALLGASLLLLPLIGTEFLPPSDEGEVRVTGEMEVGTRLDLVDRQTRLMEQIVLPAVPEALASVVRVGASGWQAERRIRRGDPHVPGARRPARTLQRGDRRRPARADWRAGSPA